MSGVTGRPGRKRLIVIPVRMESRRLPGKPLLRETGRYLVQHVYEAAVAAEVADRVVVATDSEAIRTACAGFGAPVVETASSHPSGTDRVAEAVGGPLRCEGYEFIVNLQGDEPEFDPLAIGALFETLESDPSTAVTTLACPIADRSEIESPDVVKVVFDLARRAPYFSRAPIPLAGPAALHWRHVGIYGFQRRFLLEFPGLERTPLEKAERLEQLRVLEHGFTIRVVQTGPTPPGIDTRADYDAFLRRWRR